MEGKIGSNYDYHAAPSIETIIPRSKGKGPQAFLQALADSGWGTTVSSVAQNLGSIQTTPPDPQAARALAVAKRNARKVGINPTPFNGDVAGGGGRFITIRADAKGMVDWVESALGTGEGTAKQQRWASNFGLGGTEPWCANFVSNGLARRGVTNLPSNPNYVPSYEQEWGRYAVAGGLAAAKPGDLLTFSGSHIGVYVGNGEMISGNSSDAVSRTEAGSPSMVIRPPYKGGKVKVQEGQAIPGSTSAAALGGAPGGAAVAGATLGGGVARRRLPVAAAAPLPLPNSTAVASILPGLYRQFQLGEGEEEGGPRRATIKQLSRRGV
jgi:cell wall-associated NlpC family hydrolase